MVKRLRVDNEMMAHVVNEWMCWWIMAKEGMEEEWVN